MRSIVLIVFAASLLILSCNKDKKDQTDEIIYFKTGDDFKVNTIRDYYTSMNPFCGQIARPDDSLSLIQLDLNDDHLNDFTIEVKHYLQELNQYCGHCGIFHIKTINVIPLSADAFVSLDTASGYWIRYYNPSENITPSDEWSADPVIALLEDGCMIPTVNFTDTYFGLKYRNMIGWVHVQRTANNGLSVTEFAYNKTDNRSLKAGQTE